jgi:hypothetical protein
MFEKLFILLQYKIIMRKALFKIFPTDSAIYYQNGSQLLEGFPASGQSWAGLRGFNGMASVCTGHDEARTKSVVYRLVAVVR